MPQSKARSGDANGRFAYDGLERVFHEKARLGIMTSLVSQPRGVVFSDLKEMCHLTDGNLSRHLQVLNEAGLVEIWKGYHKNRPQTLCRITDQGRRRFLRIHQRPRNGRPRRHDRRPRRNATHPQQAEPRRRVLACMMPGFIGPDNAVAFVHGPSLCIAKLCCPWDTLRRLWAIGVGPESLTYDKCQRRRCYACDSCGSARDVFRRTRRPRGDRRARRPARRHHPRPACAQRDRPIET